MRRSSSGQLPLGVWGIALFSFLLHAVTAGRYGIFRDELYYLACADHLAWGYVDHPPLSIAVLKLWRGLLGDSVVALRLAPALLGWASVVCSAVLARRLGGSHFAQILSALCVALAPAYMGATGFYSMNALDLLLWIAVYWVALRLLAERADRRWWLGLGLVVGLGLLNKYSMLFLAIGLAAGLLLASDLRRQWFDPWRLAGTALVLVIVLPHLWWQIEHDWPTRVFIDNAQRNKISPTTPAEFMGAQVLQMNPVATALWLAGLVALLFWKPLRQARALAIAWLLVLAILLVQRSKPYYLSPAYPILLAAGAVWWEAVTRDPRRVWMRLLLVVTIAITGLALAPFALPVLEPSTFMRYQAALGIGVESGEIHELGGLPQHFADRFGWPEMAQAVARVYHELPEGEQRTCLVVGRNYGEAGALLYYGLELGLPPARSQHNSFYLWGPGEGPYSVVLAIGFDRENLESTFERVEKRGRFQHPWVMPYENDLPIFVCRGWKVPLERAWALGRLYI